MPNEVFLRTRDGLSALVSARAADRILESALKRRGQTPDDVEPSQMRSALLGPVFRELEGVLPTVGLRHNLEQLARSLRKRERAESAAPERDTYSGLDEPHESQAVEGSPEAAAGSMFASSSGEPATSAETPPPPAPAVPLPDEPLSAAELELAVGQFVQIEHVRLVAVISADGSVPLSRGDGLDLTLLARLSRLAMTLLSRGGKVRQWHLGHTEGQLFLFPLRTDLLVIFGGPELNLGAVTTAFTALALEEEV